MDRLGRRRDYDLSLPCTEEEDRNTFLSSAKARALNPPCFLRVLVLIQYCSIEQSFSQVVVKY
jgi:hypothetical protein